MARITIEDCLNKDYNKFSVVSIALKRVMQLKRGMEPLVISTNREIVTALREIAAGKVKLKVEKGEALQDQEPPENTDENKV